MGRYAIIRDGVVENVTLWDGESEWSPPEGAEIRGCSADVGPGWLVDGEDLVAPPAPAPEEMDVLDRLAAALGVDRALLEQLAGQP